jgi:hypothetical protein
MEQAIMNALNAIEWGILIKLSIAAIILAIAKRYYDNFSAYAMFRSNKDLGKNVRVIVNGKEGFITQATWRFIYVRLKESDNELIIPITKWTNQKWEICKNGKDKE